MNGIEERGFALVSSAMSDDERRRLLNGLATQIAPNGARGGTRLRSAAEPAVRAVATGSMMQVVAPRVLGAAAFPVRAICVDKTAWFEQCA